jgi:predicted HAD superfamily Cof-like phosphohydrolase
MNPHLHNVEDFQRIMFGFEPPESPTLAGKEMGLFRVKLLQEELDELKEAIEKDDLIEVGDALGDLQYLLNGTVLYYGLQKKWSDIQFEIHRSNMTKIKDGKVTYREDGKVIKPDTFVPPKLKEIIYA